MAEGTTAETASAASATTPGAMTADSAAAWTGGHQSLLRVGVAVWLLLRAAELLGAAATSYLDPSTWAALPTLPPAVAALWLLAPLLALGAAALLVGRWTRAVAGLCAAVLLARGLIVLGHGGQPASADALVVALLLVLAAAPAASYGSLDASGRLDPGGGWQRPAWQGPAMRLGVVAPVAAWAVQGSSPALVLALGLWAFAAFEPRWLPGVRCDGLDVVFYDGHCGLCHRTVRWLLAEDPSAARFCFAALGSETFLSRIDPATRAALPDSVAVLTFDGRLLTRFAAVRYLLARLGGAYRLLGAPLAMVPTWLGDRCYDAVAAVRHRIFAQPAAACPLLPPALRARMLP